MQGELRATARARVWPNAMHVITGLLAAADRERERGKIFNPMTSAGGTRASDRRSDVGRDILQLWGSVWQSY